MYEVIVIGGGQAGLAAGYYLKKANKQFIVLDEQKKTGDSWRNRYDSLVLFTPRSYASLPGMEMPGDPDGFPNKNEMADYLAAYRERFDLPVSYLEQVVKLRQNGTGYSILTEQGATYHAKKVVIATGAFHTPYVPAIAKSINPDVFQIHASAYQHPVQIPEGRVLIVGAGNTGVQIAAELSQSRNVTISCGRKAKAIPQTIFGKSIFHWFGKIGLLSVKNHSKAGKWLKANEPLIGSDLKIAKRDADFVPRLIGFDGKTAHFTDGQYKEVDAVIWSTGYRNDYQWIDIPNVLDEKGSPLHTRGESIIPSLYFIGLPWQHKRGSALIYGVGEDAEFLVQRIGQENASHIPPAKSRHIW